MGVRAAHRAHLVQGDGYARTSQLPGGFAAGQAAADDVNGIQVGDIHGRTHIGPDKTLQPSLSRLTFLRSNLK